VSKLRLNNTTAKTLLALPQRNQLKTKTAQLYILCKDLAVNTVEYVSIVNHFKVGSDLVLDVKERTTEMTTTRALTTGH